MNILVLCVIIALSAELDSTYASDSPVSNRARKPGCLPLFDKQRTAFAPCLTTACLVFKDQPPIVEFGAPPNPPAQLPFRCSSRALFYPTLHGAFFDLVDEIPQLEDPYCIWADDCSFDDMKSFLEDAGPYRFIAGGALFVTPYRISNLSEPSVSLFTGSIMVLGLRSAALSSGTEDVTGLTKAFGRGAWALVVATFVAFILARAWMMFSFMERPRSFREWYWLMWDHNSAPPEDPIIRARLLFWARWWSLIGTATVAIVVLFYELAVVGFILNADGPKVDFSPLKRFAVERNSAQDYLFRLIADPNGRYANTTKVPWILCNDSSEVFDKIIDDSNPARFGLTYEEFGKYALRKQDACDKFAVFQTREPGRQYTAVWFFSIAVPHSQRTRINRRLSTLRDGQRISKILSATVPDNNDPCDGQSLAIGYKVFLPMLSAIPYPFLVLLASGLVFRCTLCTRNPGSSSPSVTHTPNEAERAL